MKLTQKQMKDLWGDGGPYSEAHLSIQERILDGSVSRTFVFVQTVINPFTFRFVKKHIKDFSQDALVIHIINQGEYKNVEYGFESNVHGSEYVSQKDMNDANKILMETRKAIIRMHQFVIDCFSDKKSADE
ncbi:MAG TPA: hypothetical protein DDW49_00455 [Deltaproteobacteria bacterium]|nr:hypothetical protein [Deltaproteobacteria bacterium]